MPTEQDKEIEELAFKIYNLPSCRTGTPMGDWLKAELICKGPRLEYGRFPKTFFLSSFRVVVLIAVLTGLVGLVAGYVIDCFPSLLELAGNLNVCPARVKSLILSLFVCAGAGSVVVNLVMTGVHHYYRSADWWLIEANSIRLSTGDALHAYVLGLLELLMYPVALLAGNGEFIAFWIGAKIAMGWVRWSGSHADGHDGAFRTLGQNWSRRRASTQMTGNALQVIVAAIIYGWLMQYMCPTPC